MSRSPGATDIGAVLQWAASALAPVAHRPHAEAERLLSAVLHVERTAILAHPEWTLSSEQWQVFASQVQRRAAGTPLPYILGDIEFFGHSFTVTPDVLIPRPETELLVERALVWIAAHPVHTLVDIGTGSGCIAISLALAEPGRCVIATDISMAALRVAQANARRHSVTDSLQMVQSDLLSAVRGPLDLIVSNPPYVADTEWDTLPYSVRQEPTHALLSGPAGLDAIRRLLDQARHRLAVRGCLLVEIGAAQGNAARALAQTAFPKATVKILSDLANRDRLLEVARA